MTLCCNLPWDTDYTVMPVDVWLQFRDVVDQRLKMGDDDG